MVKLANIITEIEDDINTDKLFSHSGYLDDVAESMGYNSDFNKLFWQYPRPLYHCTTPELYELIKTKGKLLPMDKTRGINNRSVGHAIFTTIEDLEVESLRQYYGDIVIVINTPQMKKDGFMPFVSKEPEVEEAEKIVFVLNKLGQSKEIEQIIGSSGGISEYTVIVYEAIPIKYLSLSE